MQTFLLCLPFKTEFRTNLDRHRPSLHQTRVCGESSTAWTMGPLPVNNKILACSNLAVADLSLASSAVRQGAYSPGGLGSWTPPLS